MPHELRDSILDRLQFMTVGVLMPIFFMLTGLNTLIDLGSTTFLEIFLLTTTLAVLGKIGGTAIVALLVGERLPFALSLGALVQTKGLMEVIILTIMLDRQIISGTVFSALTGMALFTTALATPLLRVALHKTPRDVTAAQRLPQT